MVLPNETGFLTIPGLRLKQIFLAKTQDEIGHAHLLFMVAADMGVKTRDEMMNDLLAGKTRFHNVFHYRAETWADQIAIAFLVDAAALQVSEQYSQSARMALISGFSVGLLAKRGSTCVTVKRCC